MTLSHKLILIRHSQSNPIATMPPNEWTLSDEGRRRCHVLLDCLQSHAPEVIVTSPEKKARETAELVAGRLKLKVHVVDDLREHDRTGEPFTSHDIFLANVAAFFANPMRLMFGNETAASAYLRFSGAVKAVTHEHTGKTVAVFTHGTVIALYLSRVLGVSAYEFWRKLEMPSMVILSLPDHRLVDVIEEIR